MTAPSADPVSLPARAAAETRHWLVMGLAFALIGPAAGAACLMGWRQGAALILGALSVASLWARPLLARRPACASWLAAAAFLALATGLTLAHSHEPDHPVAVLAATYLLGAVPAALTGLAWGAWRQRIDEGNGLWSCLVAAGIGGLVTGLLSAAAWAILDVAVFELSMVGTLANLGIWAGGFCAAWMPAPARPS